VLKLPGDKSPCYLLKHKYGIKLINPLAKKWYELCFEFQPDRQMQLTWSQPQGRRKMYFLWSMVGEQQQKSFSDKFCAKFEITDIIEAI